MGTKEEMGVKRGEKEGRGDKHTSDGKGRGVKEGNRKTEMGEEMARRRIEGEEKK